MKVIAISTTENVPDLVKASQEQGYITFVYHHADPQHTVVRDKFLYVHDDAELREKLRLLKMDITAKDMIRP